MAASKAGKKHNPHNVTGALATLVERRWLVWYFVQRQLAQNHRKSFLGPVWLFLGPLLLVSIYTLVFSELIGLRFRENEAVSNFGLYLYCGILPFLAFAETVNKGVGTIRGNSTLVQKVIFPMEILPISTAATALVGQIFGFGALVVLVAIIEGQLYWTALLFPVLMVPQILFSLGLGYLGAVLGTYLPDIQETLKAIVRASFFMTPIIWPARLAVENGLGFVVAYNPLAYLVMNYRNLFLEGEIPDPAGFLKFTLFAVLLCGVGFVIFVKLKRRFADLI